METHDEGLSQVRSELKRLGYLDHGFERFLLQDALRPRQPARALLALTSKVGLLAGLALAFVLALALAAANGNLASSPLDLAALFLHLFPPISLGAGLVFLALSGIVLLVIRLTHVRRIETLSLATATAAGAAVLALVIRVGSGVLAEGRLPQMAVLVVAAPLVVYALIKLVYHGLLTLAILFTDTAPLGRLFSKRWLGLAILSAAVLLTLPAVVSARRGEPPPPSTLPTGPGEKVLLLGIDGVLPEEVDYLLARGDLPGMGRLAAAGGRVWSYAREEEPPASFWTAVATGIPGPDHGVSALDSFRPRGVETPLARNGPLRWWWSRVEVPLGLAEYRPVLANRRRAYTLWELASRGGAPVLAVNWWSTFPAETVPGLVVAHGAYQLLAEGAQGAVAPESARPEVLALAQSAASEDGDAGDRVLNALPQAAAASVAERALRPDRFYREVFARHLPQARAAALYLPGIDIAAAGWTGGDVALADLVRAELTAADRLLAGALGGVGTVAVVLDPGRRRLGGEGRILFWRRSGCLGAPPEGSPEAVAAGLLRALGLPQSEELPAPPGACRWAPPPVVVASYGEPHRRPVPARDGGEYLQNLRSLGYL